MRFVIFQIILYYFVIFTVISTPYGAVRPLDLASGGRWHLMPSPCLVPGVKAWAKHVG